MVWYGMVCTAPLDVRIANLCPHADLSCQMVPIMSAFEEERLHGPAGSLARGTAAYLGSGSPLEEK